MTILSFGKYVKQLETMISMAATNSTRGASGWQTERAISAVTEEARPLTAAVKPTVVGSGVLRTMELVQETTYTEVGGRNYGNVPLWFDGEVHRVVNPALQHLHQALMAVWEEISRELGSAQSTNPELDNMDAYLLAVSDADAPWAMTRPTAKTSSYFGSQLAIIAPNGTVHCVTMDRVRVDSRVSAGTRYAWKALVIPNDHELSITRESVDGFTYDAATSYASLGEGRIAIFSCKFTDYLNSHGRIHEYAFREVDAAPAPVNDSYHQMNLSKRAPIPVSILKVV